jgi:osmotically inducible protein OsmC
MERKASAVWNGDLKSGSGTMRLGSGAFEGKYSFGTRFEGAPGTNPEELLGAAHAGCFSMALSLAMTQAGHPPIKIETDASVGVEASPGKLAISGVALKTRVTVAGLTADAFQALAAGAKENCLISKVLGPHVNVTLEATLIPA